MKALSGTATSNLSNHWEIIHSYIKVNSFCRFLDSYRPNFSLVHVALMMKIVFSQRSVAVGENTEIILAVPDGDWAILTQFSCCIAYPRNISCILLVYTSREPLSRSRPGLKSRPKRFEFKTKESFSRPLTTYLLFQDHHCVMQCNTVYFKYSLFTELKCNFHWLDSLHYGVTMTFCIQINKGKKSNIYKLNVPLCAYARTHVPSYSKLFFLFTLYCEQLK